MTNSLPRLSGAPDVETGQSKTNFEIHDRAINTAKKFYTLVLNVVVYISVLYEAKCQCFSPYHRIAIFKKLS
jgi:hypothetical protein